MPAVLVAVPTVTQNSLPPLSTSSITARQLLDFVLQEKITEADALQSIWTPPHLIGALTSITPILTLNVISAATLPIYPGWEHTNTHLTALFPGLPRWAGTRKVKTTWILLKQETASEWHQLGNMQVCTLLQTDNHASTPPRSFFTGHMPFLPPNHSVKALNAYPDCGGHAPNNAGMHTRWPGG